MINVDAMYQAQYRYAQHYLTRLYRVNELYLSDVNQIVQGITQFKYEWAQIKHAQQWTSQHLDRDDSIAKMCSDYAAINLELLDLGQDVHEQIQWYEFAIQGARRIKNRMAEGHHLTKLGLVKTRQGVYDHALVTLKESLQIFKEIEDRQATIDVLNHIGHVYFLIGDYVQAAQFYKDSLTLCRDEDNGYADTLCGLGDVAYANNRFDDATQYFEQGVEIYQQLDNQKRIAYALNRLGETVYAMGNLQATEEYYLRSLRAFESLKYDRGVAKSLSNLGYVALDRGNASAAKDYSLRSLHLWQKLGDPREIAIALSALGRVAIDQGEYAEAEKNFQDGLALSEQNSDQMGIGMSLNRLGLVAYSQKDYSKARLYYERSRTAFEFLNDAWGIAACTAYLGNVTFKIKHFHEAVDYYTIALDICQDIGDTRGLVIALTGLGNTYIELDQQNVAGVNLKKAFETALESENLPLILSALLGIAKFHQKQDRLKYASEILGMVLNHSSISKEVEDELNEQVAQLKAKLPAQEVDLALQRGKDLSFEAIQWD